MKEIIKIRLKIKQKTKQTQKIKKILTEIGL